MKTSPTGKSRPAVAARCEKRREDILEMAIRLFARDGYADCDLQVLADQLGVGKGTLYRYFGSKQQLFLAAVDRVVWKLRQYIDAAIEGAEEPLERIRLGIHAYLRYFAEHPEAVEMFIQERAHFKDRKRPAYFEHAEERVKRWRDLYLAMMAQGRVRPMPADRITDVMGDLLYGAMFTSYIARRTKPPEATAEDIIDVVFHGILSEAERHGKPRPRPKSGI